MNLKNVYWYFDGAFSPKLCDEIIKYGNQHSELLALTGAQKEKKLEEEDIKDLKQKRDSNIVWLSDKWIYKEIHPYVNTANYNAGWNFEWNWSEACQFTKYRLNQFYDWHCDSWDKIYEGHENKFFNGKIRKLSVSVLLSDPKEYKGGDFELQNRSDDQCPLFIDVPKLKRGSVIVFPSFEWHRVKPVTEGTRYSLVVWNLGQPFK